MNTSQEKIAGLRCQLVDALPDGESPRLLVILNHGFGASGDDLVDLAPALIGSSQRIARNSLFVFPEAPVDLTPMGMPGGRAWWPINMAQLAEINQTRDFEQLSRLQPEGMRVASEQLAATVAELQKRYDIPDQMTVLGGFSQGAMVSTDVTVRIGVCPALLVLFSGTLLNRDAWEEKAAKHPGCDVLQSHGTEDPLLPYETAVQLQQLLKDNGFKTEFIEFAGGHTIPMAALQRFSQRLQVLLAD
jgi:phospholipase/carboxylesterase